MRKRWEKEGKSKESDEGYEEGERRRKKGSENKIADKKEIRGEIKKEGRREKGNERRRNRNSGMSERVMG